MKLNKQGIPVYQAVVVALLLFIFGWSLATTVTANAHTVSIYFPKKWASSPTYSFGDIDSPLNTSTAKQSIHTGDNEWDFTNGSSLDFYWNYVEDSSVVWLGGACTTVPSNGQIWIMTYSLSGLASENTCTSGSQITKSTIRLDDTRSNWYTGSSTSVPSGKYDLRSVITHEFGHAGGFAHLSGSTICSGSTRQTMCSGGLPTGTSYKRSLESHDKHTFANAY